MKKPFFLIALSLLISLIVYLFFRTERTLVTELFISVISLEKYTMLKETVTEYLPLSGLAVYALPEGLWVFCITLTSKFLFFKAGKWEIECVYVPLLCCVGLELLQLFHFVNGRFDFWDIGLSVIFWFIARYIVSYRPARENIFEPFTNRSIFCIVSYLIVYFAHVWR